MPKRILYGLGLLAAIILVSFLWSGCSSDKEKTEGTSEISTLPQDSGEKSLLDTTVTRTTPTTGEVVQKPPAQQQPQPKPQVKPTESKPVAPKTVKTLVLAENSALEVSLLTKLATGENKVGDKFRALVKGPVTEGETLNLPDGTMLEGQIAELSDGKAEGEKAYIKLRFTGLILPGEDPLPLEGWLITNDGSGIIRPGDQGTTIAKDAAVGAAAGGVIGAVTGGEVKDAAKGAVVGAVAGGVLGAVLHKDQVTLNEGRVLKVNVTTSVYQEKVVKTI